MKFKEIFSARRTYIRMFFLFIAVPINCIFIIATLILSVKENDLKSESAVVASVDMAIIFSKTLLEVMSYCFHDRDSLTGYGIVTIVLHATAIAITYLATLATTPDYQRYMALIGLLTATLHLDRYDIAGVLVFILSALLGALGVTYLSFSVFLIISRIAALYASMRCVFARDYSDTANAASEMVDRSNPPSNMQSR